MTTRPAADPHSAPLTQPPQGELRLVGGPGVGQVLDEPPQKFPYLGRADVLQRRDGTHRRKGFRGPHYPVAPRDQAVQAPPGLLTWASPQRLLQRRQRHLSQPALEKALRAGPGQEARRRLNSL